MDLIRGFIDQIGFVLDTRKVLVVGGIEISRLIHVEPYSVVFRNLAVLVEAVFPPLSDFRSGPIGEYGGSAHE